MTARPPAPRLDPVTRYATDVTEGRIVACRYVRLACQRHLDDLVDGPARGLRWEPKTAVNEIAFFGLLHHYKGRDDLIVLTPWQQFVVGCAFGWKRADGTRRFRTVYLECASKQGKSTIAGGAGLRLAFFDDEPGAEVYAAATKRDQAKIPWNAARAMVLKSPLFRKRITALAGRLVQESTGSFFAPLGRDSDSDQGINPNGAIIDELHVHATRDLMDNIEKAAAVRRQPMIWKITTPGVKRHGVWMEERADAVAIIEGRVLDDSVFAIIYTLDEARTEWVGSSFAISWMRGSCTCRSRDGGSTRRSASFTLTDQPSASGSATPVTSGTWPSETRSTGSDGTSGEPIGSELTESGRMPPTGAGRSATRSSSEPDDGSRSTGSPRRSTPGESLSRADGAPSGGSRTTTSGSITTTRRGGSAGSSVPSATELWDSSETVSQAYSEHSPICKVRSARLEGERIQVQFLADDPFDESVWIKANPNLGVSVQLEFLRERAAKAKRSPGALAAFLRFHMSLPTQQSTKAIDIAVWDAASRSAPIDGVEGELLLPAIPDGAAVYLGLDLASVRDLTALEVLWRDPEGTYHVESRFWCPEEGIETRSRLDGVPYKDWVRDGYLVATPGNVTDYDFVLAEVLRIAERLFVVELGYDRWNASQLITDLMAAGANCVPISQTHAGLAAGWRDLDKAVLDARLRHGGHPVLRWMAGNVEVETDAGGNQKPSKARSAERIDGMVSLTMAFARSIANGDVAVWTAA